VIHDDRRGWDLPAGVNLAPCERLRRMNPHRHSSRPPGIFGQAHSWIHPLTRFFDVTFAFVSVHLESELYDVAVAGPGVSAKARSSPTEALFSPSRSRSGAGTSSTSARRSSINLGLRFPGASPPSPRAG